MASVRYYIEKRRDENGRLINRNVPILLYFSFDGKRLQLNTGERVDAGDWDSGKQMVRQEAPGSKQLNRYLSSQGQELMDIYREARATGIRPGTRYLREQLRYRRRRDGIDFFDVLMRFIDENHAHWSIHTFRKIRTVYNHLRTFSETEKIKIEFHRINEDFLDHYVRFFKIKFGHSNNTIAKNISVLKWFLNWASERGYNKSTIYRKYKLDWEAKPRVKVDDLVLDWEELARLNGYMPDSRNLSEVKDIFCFMCFSGLTLSRVYQLKKSYVLNDHVRIPGTSPGEFYSLPLNDHALALLKNQMDRDHPGNGCFPVYPNSYFNRLLKQLGRKAGINRFVNLDIHSGTEHGTRQVPKYEILSSKMAVNTFLYNGLRLGVSAEVLAYVTGRKTLAGIDRIRPLLEQAAFNEMEKFNPSFA